MKRESVVMTVIYIDDDPEDREMFKDIVGEIDSSIHVHLVSRCSDLIELLQSMPAPPDYIFVDFLLSGANGEDCMVKVKSIQAFKHIPVVMMSGVIDNTIAERFERNGAHCFIHKTGIYNEYMESIAKVITTRS